MKDDAATEKLPKGIFRHAKSKYLHMSYRFRGKLYRETTGEMDPKKAERKRKDKLAEIRMDKAGKLDFVPNTQVRVRELLEALEGDFRLKETKSLPQIKSHLKPLYDVLGRHQARHLTAEMVDNYIECRLEKGKARTTVNRETQLLGQAFTLAIERKKLRAAPKIRHLSEKGNARTGFFEKPDFEAVIAHLPEYLKGFARFGFLCGWRKSEIRSLLWEDVDLMGRVVRLRAENSKNGEARELDLDDELWEIIERQYKLRECRNPDGIATFSLRVFHLDGAPIGDIRRAWRTACKKAGLQGKLFHDLRRTAVRNMVEAGVPEKVAMEIVGHKTRSMFDRYHIVARKDRREAMKKVQAHLRSLPESRQVISIHEATGGVQ